MDISALNSTYINSIKDSASNSSIEKTLKSDMSNATDDELMDVCKQFEAYFIEQVFKNMEKALVPGKESSSGAESTLVDYYKDELMSKYASNAAEQSTNGLAQMLYEQMKRNYGNVDVTELDENAKQEAAEVLNSTELGKDSE